VGVRQRQFECQTETRVDLSGDPARGEAGLTAFMNERHHYEIAVTTQHGRREVCVRQRIGRLSVISARTEAPSSGPVRLGIDADKDTYTFWFERDDRRVVLDIGETRYLSAEVAGGFTGVYLGLYATTQADFDWFQCRMS
jgi:alpha-N-arabinofuranosidase